jgi:hypothetical protein
MYTNQIHAIETSIRENFASGVHFHATGTGKSWIALTLIQEFEKRHKSATIFWICEQKSILQEQFQKETLEKKGFKDLLSKFILFDFSQTKSHAWVDSIQSATIWKKPILVIINRAFLVSCDRYTRLKIPIDLIIHDECHSISNITTREFYSFVFQKYKDVKCIGFSATPCLLYAPFSRIITHYSIYDACCDKIILPPKVVWIKSNKLLQNQDIRHVCKQLFDDLPYKKVIVWSGMITLCKTILNEWKSDPYFSDWTIAMDTSISSENYEAFRASSQKGLLFCAGKHREGSDIPFLDGCVFLDHVAERNPKTFIQSLGRVLRRDPGQRKKYGLIVDISAKSPIEICSRINHYLQEETSMIFPYEYTHEYLKDPEFEHIQLNTLNVTITPSTTISRPMHTAESMDLFQIASQFRRPIPASPAYNKRLHEELQLFSEKKLFHYLSYAIDILQMTNTIPHVTRGSCGSSLICYLLGISNIDPVKYNIKFARFLNEYRSTLPDIDFDFPHNLRDEVFLQIYLKWPGQVARISNHIYYHKKSALRKAVQNAGIRKQLSTYDLYKTLAKLPKALQNSIQTNTKKLENTFRTYSLHCGGIVFYPEGIPKDITLKSTTSHSLSQIVFNKHDISKNKQCKIDILASRALTQLYELCGKSDIDFDANTEDTKTAELFSRGDNIGITLAESPLIRKTLIQLQPKSVHDIATCLAIIRPAAKHANTKGGIVYDDDAIDVIKKYLRCTDAYADKIRRDIIKMDKDAIQTVLQAVPKKEQDTCKQIMYDLRKYSFCKSHAYSYAQLVWKLGYMKAHKPKEFWKATLQHCESHYRKWVHIYEAKLAGVDILEDNKTISIYAKNRRKSMGSLSPEKRLRRFGLWSLDPLDLKFYPDCYLRPQDESIVCIRGLIANVKYQGYGKKRSLILFIGYAPQKYIEVRTQSIPVTRAIGIVCYAKHIKDAIYECLPGKKNIQIF